jgi:hypothetical protein
MARRDALIIADLTRGSLQRLGVDAVVDVPVEGIALQYANLGCHRYPLPGPLP